jgi:hypothetical protein
MGVLLTLDYWNTGGLDQWSDAMMENRFWGDGLMDYW